MNKMKGLGAGKMDFRSRAAKRLYDEFFNGQTEVKEPEIPRQKQVETPVEEKKEVIINLENLISNTKKRESDDCPLNLTYSNPNGRPPSLIDFDVYYFENFFGIVGDQHAKYRTLLNMINNTSMLYLGPSSGGKSVIQDAAKELLPEGMVVTLNEPGDIDDVLNPENTIGKAWFARELQTLLRGSKNQKDVVKLLSNHEAYKGMKIEFFAATIARENPYFQNYVIPNKELMRRLDIIDVESSFDKVKNIRDSINRKRMEDALSENSNGYTKEYFRDWMTHLRNLELGVVVDPFCAFHDQYFILSFKSFDPIKRYHKLEDALLKMQLEESTYQMDGREICILSIREKYRADCFRRNINRTLEKIDDAKTIRKYYGWTDKELEAYYESIKKSREDIDWQACWESGLESLRQAHQKGLIPFSLISEYINRHVINGKVTAVDDYTGQAVVLAEHPPKQIKRDVIVITNLERMLEPIAVEAPAYSPQAIPEHKEYAKPLEKQKELLCLPPGRDDSE